VRDASVCTFLFKCALEGSFIISPRREEKKLHKEAKRLHFLLSLSIEGDNKEDEKYQQEKNCKLKTLLLTEFLIKFSRNVTIYRKCKILLHTHVNHRGCCEREFFINHRLSGRRKIK
jgi:hypothetical protein